MSDTPPPLTPSQPYQQPPYSATPAKSGGGGWLAGCGLGCLVAVIACAVIGFFGYKVISQKLGETIANFTSTEFVPIEAPAVTQAEINETLARFEDLAASVAANGGLTEPLILTGQEINTLLFHHPQFAKVAGMAAVTIANDKLTSEVSVKLDDLPLPAGPIKTALAGRFLNGVGTFSLGIVAGRPALYMEDFQVNGFVPPAEILAQLKTQNMLENAGNDPELSKALEKISDIRIEGDKLIITPKVAVL